MMLDRRDAGAGGETLFISDLHLTPDRPKTVALFLEFLDRRAPMAKQLYILGDLFDAWIGDDDDTPPYPEIRNALRRLTATGTRCGIMRGNRDFLLGRRFARETGTSLLGDPSIIQLDGERVLLMHGDLLCTDDIAYQRFRRRIRNPLVIRLFLWKSLATRRGIADDYRRKSGSATSGKTEQIMDVNQRTVARYLARHRGTRLIHGHTHRPADHRLLIDGVAAHRSVLAEWHPDRGELLAHHGGRWHREPIVPAIEPSPAGPTG